MKICLTGGIACGKSLLSFYLNELGFETIDADDVAHALITPEERRRLASVVFKDPVQRKRLEDELHPRIKARIEAAHAEKGDHLIAVIPLLFEVHWESYYDIICCITSTRENQISRMRQRRGYSLEDAEARIAAQMPVSEKAARSHYVIPNDGSADDLKREAVQLAAWLKEKLNERRI